MPKNLPKIIVIVGPTASGKTGCGIEIAKKHMGEVIAVDSRTVFRGMDVGTAKPKGEWQRSSGLKLEMMLEGAKPFMVLGVPHWGFDLVDPDEEFTVSMFQKYAQKKIADIVSRGRLPILVGGTGLFMDAVVNNMSFPEVAPDEELREQFEIRTAADLFDEYKRLDPEGALNIDKHNKRRLVRALEVTKITGKPFSAQRKQGPKLYDVLWLGMVVQKEMHEQHMKGRVDEMVADGLVDEVRVLNEKYGCEIPAMSGIGYREVCRFFAGKQKLSESLDDIKLHTRQFAKRQMTWFRKNKEIKWISGCDEAKNLVQHFIS